MAASVHSSLTRLTSLTTTGDCLDDRDSSGTEACNVGTVIAVGRPVPERSANDQDERGL